MSLVERARASAFVRVRLQVDIRLLSKMSSNVGTGRLPQTPPARRWRTTG